MIPPFLCLLEDGLGESVGSSVTTSSLCRYSGQIGDFGAPRTPSSYNLQEREAEGAPAFQGMWYYVWTLVSVTFIALVIPLGIFLLPYNPATVARRTSSQPWRTVVADKEHSEPDADVLESCDAKLVPDLSPPVPESTIRTAFVPDSFTRQHRHMFCVFDTKYHRKSVTYLPKLVPYSYCSYILYYSVTFFEQGVRFKRPNMDHVYIQTFNAMKAVAKLRRGFNVQIPIVITVGGDLVDSINISRAVRSPLSRLTLATMLIEFVKLHDLQGINLDWDHPTGDCGRQKDTDNIVEFFRLLDQRRDGQTLPLEFLFVISVPPRPDDGQLYAINNYSKVINHIVVLTHKLLRGRHVVGCTGRRQETATAVRGLKGVLNNEADRKVCYSVSVGPDTFRATEPRLGASSSGPSAIDPTTHQPGKAGYFEVCKLTEEAKTNDPECSLRYKVDELTGEFLLAAHVTPENIGTRMTRSYDDGIGDSCVAVFDMDLDDYAGHCPMHDGKMSPLTAAFVSS